MAIITMKIRAIISTIAKNTSSMSGENPFVRVRPLITPPNVITAITILRIQFICGFRILESLDRDGFASCVTAAELEENEIYGAYPEWSSKDAEYLWDYVEDLKQFLSKANENDESIVMYLY